MQTRGSDPQQELLAHLAVSLEYKDSNAVDAFVTDTREETGLQNYMLLTRRVLEALLWYKRFAESILNVLPSDEAEEDAL